MTNTLIGYVDWTPDPASTALLEDIHRVLTEWRANLPLSLRQVYYRLVGRGYPKGTAFENRLKRAFGRARRARLLDWDTIRDLVDFDSVRPSGISSIDAEHVATFDPAIGTMKVAELQRLRTVIGVPLPDEELRPGLPVVPGGAEPRADKGSGAGADPNA